MNYPKHTLLITPIVDTSHDRVLILIMYVCCTCYVTYPLLNSHAADVLVRIMRGSDIIFIAYFSHAALSRTATQPYTWSQARALCSVPPTRSERHVASNMVDRDTGQRQWPQTRQACQVNAGDKIGKLPTKRKSGTGLTIFPVSACLIRCVWTGKTVQSHTLGRKCSVLYAVALR